MSALSRLRAQSKVYETATAPVATINQTEAKMLNLKTDPRLSERCYMAQQALEQAYTNHVAVGFRPPGWSQEQWDRVHDEAFKAESAVTMHVWSLAKAELKRFQRRRRFSVVEREQCAADVRISQCVFACMDHDAKTRPPRFEIASWHLARAVEWLAENKLHHIKSRVPRCVLH